MNRNLVITGASKGIGRSIIEHFAAAGYHIYFCGRTASSIAALELELTAKYPQQTIKGYAVDVRDAVQLRTFATAILEHAKQIDVLVNNAGIFTPGSIIDEADGVLASMIETNLYSAYHLTRWLAPTMMAARSGYIINMGSIASLQAYANGGAYSISKYALLGFSDNLRLEMMPHNIAVTAVLPGATMTDSWAGSGVSSDRIMEADDIAKMVFSITTLSPRAVVERIVVRPLLGDL